MTETTTDGSARDNGATRIGDVVYLNLMYLTALREAAARDMTQASYQYGLSRDELEEFASLSFESIQAIASRMDQAMMTLRYAVKDIRELMAMPSPLAALVACNRARQSATAT